MTLDGKSKVVSWLLDFQVQVLASIVMPRVLSPRLETQGRMLAAVADGSSGSRDNLLDADGKKYWIIVEVQLRHMYVPR
jgi:hypothetical protein